MTFWAVVLVLGMLAAALSWRASRRAFEDGRWETVGPHESIVGREQTRQQGARQ
jgi:hypothetical protein